MNAGSLTLSYDAGARRFTANLHASPGFTAVSVTLFSQSGTNTPMTNTTGGANPSVWQYTLPSQSPAQGNWSATAMLQGTGTCTGNCSVT